MALKKAQMSNAKSHIPHPTSHLARSFINLFVCILSLLLACGCVPKKEIRYSGQTMGTTYSIKVVSGYFNSLSGLENAIKKRLDEINQSMSTFLKDSEISKFNAMGSNRRPMTVSKDLFQVMTVAKHLFTVTDGAWDGTLDPLVRLWGFGASELPKEIPSDRQIKALMSRIGFDGIVMADPRQLGKIKPEVTVDLGSIAKGYAVDAIADLIKSRKQGNFLVEIGGEVYASGTRKDGTPWRIGVNVPVKGAPADTVYRALALKNQALATSGDYRNFFEAGGRRYSHVMDPKTGRPVENGVVSVSVLSDTCTFADGLATALMVLGHESGIDLVNRLEAVECLIVVGDRHGRLKDYYSEGFREKLLDG